MPPPRSGYMYLPPYMRAERIVDIIYMRAERMSIASSRIQVRNGEHFLATSSGAGAIRMFLLLFPLARTNNYAVAIQCNRPQPFIRYAALGRSPAVLATPARTLSACMPRRITTPHSRTGKGWRIYESWASGTTALGAYRSWKRPPVRQLCWPITER